MTVVSKTLIVSGGREVDQIRLTFDDTWSGYGKEVVFWREDPVLGPYSAPVSADGICTVPWKLTEKSGAFVFAVKGINGSAVMPTNAVKVKLPLGIPGDSVNVPDAPEPTVYEQILAMFGESGQQIEDFSEHFQNANWAVSENMSGNWGALSSENAYRPYFDMETGRYNVAGGKLMRQDGDCFARCRGYIIPTGETTVLLKPGYRYGQILIDRDGNATWDATFRVSADWQRTRIRADACYMLVFYVGSADDETPITPEEAKNAVVLYNTSINPVHDENQLCVARKADVDFVFNAAYETSENGYVVWNGSSPESAAVPNYLYFATGVLNIKNPNGYTVIFNEVSDGTENISRTTYTNKDIRIPVKYGHIYALSVYKSGLSENHFIAPEIYFYKGQSREIPIALEQGTFDEGGSDAANATRVRTQKIETNENCVYILTFPDGYTANANRQKKTTGVRGNLSATDYVRNTSFSVSDYEGFLRFVWYFGDGASALSPDDLNGKVKLYEVPISHPGQITVAASDSLAGGDIQTDGKNDQRILQGLLNNIDSALKIDLTDGTFHFSEFYTTRESGQKAMLFLDDAAYYYGSSGHAVKTFAISGMHTTRLDSEWKTVFKMADDVKEDFSSGEYSFLLVPRAKEALDTDVGSSLILKISNIGFLANVYTKKFIFIDATQAQAAMIENVEIRGDASRSGLARFPTKPSTDCVGIRAGHGSNNGVQNYIKHCMVYYCGKGYSITGEHYVLEDCLAHHCYIGFAFGDCLTKGNYEHPNIMLGCSIEGCYRLMELNRYGQEEGDETAPYNTLICIGLSTEISWQIPTDEGGGTAVTLPVKEIRRGAYRGRMELDYGAIAYPFEKDGSGKYMKYTVYTSQIGAGIYEGTGGAKE